MKKLNLSITAAAVSLFLLSSGCAKTQPASSGAGNSSAASPSSAASVSAPASSQKVFTLNELKKYNGQNGAPAYVAVSGVVYDVTHAKGWDNGSHHGYAAGQDLTQAIKEAPHGTSVLSGLPVVGKLQK